MFYRRHIRGRNPRVRVKVVCTGREVRFGVYKLAQKLDVFIRVVHLQRHTMRIIAICGCVVVGKPIMSHTRTSDPRLQVSCSPTAICSAQLRRDYALHVSPCLNLWAEAVYRCRHMPPAPATRMLPDVYVVSLSALLSITSATRATCITLSCNFRSLALLAD